MADRAQQHAHPGAELWPSPDTWPGWANGVAGTETTGSGTLSIEAVPIRGVAASTTTADAGLSPPDQRDVAAATVLRYLQHIMVDDTSDRLLTGLVTGLMAGVGRVHLVAHGNAEMRPWQAITDPAVAPGWALPYAAQWTGGQMPPPLAGEAPRHYVARARHEVVYPRGMRRGASEAVIAAVRATLTGSRTVQLVERAGEDDWAVAVVTYDSETPDPQATRAAAERFAPAGIRMLVGHTIGQTYQQLRATNTDYQDVKSSFDTYDQVRTTTP